jgi:hypothetical protein
MFVISARKPRIKPRMQNEEKAATKRRHYIS